MSETKSIIPQMVIESITRMCEARNVYSANKAKFWSVYDDFAAILPSEVIDESADCWPLHFRSLKVVEAVGVYDSRDTRDVEKDPVAVFSAIHDLYQELHAPFMRKRSFRPSQSIQQLHLEGISPGQICREWGLVDKFGNADLDAFEKELKEPGCITGGKSWMHPRRAEFERQRMSMRQEYESLVKSLFGMERDPVMRNFVTPESLDELYEQGVGVSQTAKMLGMSEAEVGARFRELEESGVQQAITPVSTKDGVPFGDYVPTKRDDSSGVDELYAGGQESMTLEELEDRTGWSRNVAKEKYLAWDVADLKGYCRDQGITIRGNLSTEKIVERILDYEQKHVQASLIAAEK